jgi:gas vesicle protein
MTPTHEGHAMNAQELKQRIDRIEDLVDDAKDALQVAGAPEDLKQAVETLHQQAREAKHSNNLDEAMLRQAAMRIEQSADRAKDVCGQAGQVDPQVRQAVMRAHEEASRLKHEIEADSPA